MKLLLAIWWLPTVLLNAAAPWVAYLCLGLMLCAMCTFAFVALIYVLIALGIRRVWNAIRS